MENWIWDLSLSYAHYFVPFWIEDVQAKLYSLQLHNIWETVIFFLFFHRVVIHCVSGTTVNMLGLSSGGLEKGLIIKNN
jgi:hypothetical protein